MSSAAGSATRTLSAVLDRVDAELAAHSADRAAHPADPSIALLVQVGKLPTAALDYQWGSTK